MDSRKSLANPLVENLRSPSGSLRRRSSIAITPSAVGLVDNDDEAERAALRLESNSSSTSNPLSSSNRRSLNLGTVIGGMSSPQIAEGIAECIKLNTQNKINMKNAFNLNMIDFMSYLVRNRDEGLSNLHVAGTSLDVSAKIYALRVDVLHQDILKMAGNLDNKEKKSDDNENDNEANEDPAGITNENAAQNNERLQKKKKKKRSSQKIRTTIEALQGDVDTVCLTPVMFGEADCQTTDMLYQAMLPQHCGVGLGLHPYKDIIMDDNLKDMARSNDNEPRIPWPPLQFDANRDIVTMYPNFEFLNWSSDQECNDRESCSQETPSLIHDDLAFDLDASLPADDEPTPFTGRNFYDMNDDNEENVEGYHVEMRAPDAIVNVPNFIARLPEKKLDYSFFSDAVNIRWVGTAHWKIKSAVKHLSASKVVETCRQGAGRKKKDLEINFYDENNHCDAALTVPKRNTTKLQTKTVRLTWSEKKLELPRENHDDAMKSICQYFLRPDDIVNFKNNTAMDTTVLSDEHGEYDYGNENDTINYCPNVEADDAQGDDDAAHDCDYNMDTTSGGLISDNLIEAPKLTQKILIPYSQRAKKLDMRKLRKCIWNHLACKSGEDKEEEDVSMVGKKLKNISTVKEEMKFTNVVVDLPKVLNNNDAEDLSFAIAFVSLLHLANEKCLKILAEEDFSDITVAQDTL